MNNPKKIYILLIAVVGVWGVIAYKIANGIAVVEPKVKTQVINSNKYIENRNIKLDTFSILNIKRDPFLGNLNYSTKANQINKVKTKIKKPIKANINVTYSGLIQNKGSKKKVFVVNIKNQQYLLTTGQTVNNVTLISGNNKLIIIRFNGHKQIIKI